jgi:uncharacterized phage-like protein YoqJ
MGGCVRMLVSKKNVIAVTGHRVVKTSPEKLLTLIKLKLASENPTRVLTGMAIGFDQLVALACIEENIPWTAVIPCMGQTRMWPPEAKRRYRNLMKRADEIHIVTPGAFGIWKLHERNRWLVDHADLIVAYWNGLETGGTYRAIEYAQGQKRTVDNLYSLCHDVEEEEDIHHG